MKNAFIILSLFFAPALLAQSKISVEADFTFGGNTLREFKMENFEHNNAVGALISSQISLDYQITESEKDAVIIGLGYRGVNLSNSVYNGSGNNSLNLETNYIPLKLQLNNYVSELFETYLALSYLLNIDSEIKVNNVEMNTLSTASLFGAAMGGILNLGGGSYMFGINFLSSPFSKKDIQFGTIAFELGFKLDLFKFKKPLAKN